ncbi:MAG: type I restriction enzyme HsdR N-terminal domain-containing protein, partial [Verrucomicrobiota bacterium]|nr:type I restriction enzyme HsdR N-terminal domain-containing protein [Verrucomicrobiota bacterium]
ATKEEEVRQKLLAEMIRLLGYPRGLIAVEKTLGSLAHLPRHIDPKRRIDLLCYTPGKEGLSPLLLIECKSEEGNSEEEAKEQALGYNQWIKAPFVALARPDKISTFWKEESGWKSLPFLPPYSQLVSSLQ